MRPTLYNARTRQPETLPEEDLHDSILSGTHSYPAGTDVNVVDGSGKPFAVKAEELQNALSDGYQIESPKQYAARKYAEENAGAEGALKAFAAKAADEAALGIPGVIFEKTADPFEVAKYEALKKEHKLASTLGAATGFGASLLYGGPLFEAAGAAGRVATSGMEAMLAKQLAAQGMKKGFTAAAKEIAAKAATKAAQLGVEGVVISSPRAVTEAALGDPEQAAETLLVGGGIGAAMGLGSGFLSQTFKEVTKAASRVMAEREADALKRAGQSVPAELAAQAEGTHAKSATELVSDLVGQKKPNAQAITAAAEAEGVPLFPGMTEGSRFVQDAASNLSQRGTIAGATFQGEVERTFDALQKASERLVGKTEDAATLDISRRQAGILAQQDLMENLSTRLETINQKFRSIEERTGQMPVEPEIVDRALKKLESSEVFKLKTLGGLKNEASAVMADLQSAGSVNDVARLFSLADGKARAAGRAADYEAERFWKGMKETLRSVEDETVGAGTKAMGLKGAEGKKAGELLTAERDSARKEYAEFKTFLKEIREDFKLGRGQSQRALVDQLGAIDPSELSRKLFAPNKVKTLNALAEKFPSSFERLKQVYLNDLKEAAMRDGKINLGTLVRRLDALEPESRALILGQEGAQRFENVKTLVQSLPKSGNPSKTSYAESFGRMFTPQGVMDNVNDAMTYAALKNKDRVAGLLRTEQAMKRAAHVLDELPDALDKLATPKSGLGSLPGGRFSTSTSEQKSVAALIRLFDHDEAPPKSRREAYKKAAKIIPDAVANPEKTARSMGTLVNAFSTTGAPTVAQQFSQKMTQALQYLDRSLPKPYAPAGFLSKTEFEPSDSQIAAFERKLKTVMDPFTTFEDLAAGQLTAEQVEALQTVYPKLHLEMQRRVLDWGSKREKPVAYPLRLKLSLLLGIPLEQTVQPEAIAALQMTFAKPDAVEQEQASSNMKLSMADQTSSEMQDPSNPA
jgi:hypothetical protein